MKIQVRDLLVVMLALALGFVVYFNIESYEEEQHSAWSQEAFDQQFLALKLHLENFDHQVILADNINLLFSETALNPLYPNQNDLIIFTQSELNLTNELSERLLAWIALGGHAVVDLQSSEGASVFSTNQFLKTLSVSTQVSEDERLINSDVNPVTKVNTEDFEQIDVNLYADVYIELKQNTADIVYSAAPFEKYETTQPTLIQLEYGDGLISLMTDVFVWDNYQLQDNDNALWLHQLVKNTETVYVFSYRDPVMWYQVIAHYSPAFYWILLTTVLFFAWFFAVRFGAVISLSHHVITYFSQHIKAAGEYYWANEQQQKMVDEVRQQLKDELSNKLSKQNLSNDDLINALSKISLWPTETLQQLMFDNSKFSQSHFTKLMQGLQKLRKMI